MTALQFRNIIAKIGLSQVQIAHLLGVTPRTARRWALDEVRIPTVVAKVLRLILVGDLSVQQIRAVKP